MTTRQQPTAARPPTFTPVELILVGGLAALVGAGVMVWVTGWLLTLGHVTTGLGEAPGIVARLAGSLADPAAAWPEPDRARLPGPIVFYTTLVLLLTLSAVLTGLTVARLRDRRDRRPGDAHWATRHDLEPLRVRQSGAGRLVLGRRHPGRGLLAGEPGRSIIVLGPSRSGKTSGLAIPAILEWDGPVIATSVKTDLVTDTAGWRATKGDVLLYDPTGATGMAASSWSPLAGCDSWMGAVRTAHAMAATVKATGTAGGLTDGDFWYASAAKLLAPLLYAAAAHGLPIAQVVTWLNTQEEKKVTTLLEAAGVREACDAFTASTRRADNQKSSIYTTAETVLAAYEDPAVAESAATSTIDPDTLLSGDHTLYLCAPRDDQRRLRPLFVGLLHQVLTAANRQAAQRPAGRLERPLLVVLDEAANIAPLPDLDEVASTAQGLGITLVTIWQDLAQIKARYHAKATTIVNNHAGMLVLRGMRDLDALTQTSDLLGRHTPPRRPDDPPGLTKPLMAAHSIRALPEGRAIGIYQHLPPFQVQLRPHYTTPHLRTRAALPVPAQPPAPAARMAAAAAWSSSLPDATAEPAARTVVVPSLALVAELADAIAAIAQTHGASDVRVFGSVARGTAVPGSNLNLLLDIPPAGRLLKLQAMREQLSALVGCPVEVLCVDMLQNPEAAHDAIALSALTLEPQP